MLHKCRKCLASKAPSQFGRNARGADGYDFYCFDCRGEQVTRAYSQAPKRRNVTLRDKLLPVLLTMRDTSEAREWYDKIVAVLPVDVQERLGRV